MNCRKADRRSGRGVRWRDFKHRGSLTLTMEPRLRWLSLIVSLSLSLPASLSFPLSPCLVVFLSFSLSRFSSSPLLSSSLSSPLSLLPRSKHSLLAVAAKMHHLSAAAHPLLPHVCSFSRQAGLKSQLRIEPSRLKPVSNQPSPPPTPLPNPRLVSCWLQWKNG